MSWAWHTPHPIAHDHPPHPVRHLAGVFGAICQGLLAAAASLTRALPPLLATVLLPLALTRLMRARRRILAVLAQVEAGTWRDPRPSRPRAKPPVTTQATRRPKRVHLPRRRGWLGHVTDHHVRGHASQLTHLLTDPGSVAILQRAPAHARAAIARALRGPARLLDLRLPDCLQFAGPPRPPYRRKPRPQPARAPRWGALPSDIPLPRPVLRMSRAMRRRFGKGG